MRKGYVRQVMSYARRCMALLLLEVFPTIKFYLVTEDGRLELLKRGVSVEVAEEVIEILKERGVYKQLEKASK